MSIEILKRIEDRDVKVGIIGLGYVGLPLAIEFVKAGFNVIGFDVDESKIEMLDKGETYIKHIPTSVLQDINKTNLFSSTTDFSYDFRDGLET